MIFRKEMSILTIVCVFPNEMDLHEICEFPLRKAHDFFNTLSLPGSKAEVASKIVQEIKEAKEKNEVEEKKAKEEVIKV